jgi:hypothetical protein
MSENMGARSPMDVPVPGYRVRRRRRITVIVVILVLLVLGWLPSYSQKECIDLMAGRRELRHRFLGITVWHERLPAPLAELYAKHVGQLPGSYEWRTVRDRWFEFYGLIRYEGQPGAGREVCWLVTNTLPRLVVNEPLGGGVPLNAYGFTDSGKRELITRGLDAARRDDLHHPLSTYIGRVQEAVEFAAYPAGPEDFPSASEALEDSVFDAVWRPRIEQLAASRGTHDLATGQ